MALPLNMGRGEENDEQIFSFGHRDVFFQNLETFFNRKQFFDTTLICNGQKIRAHKVVLACYSPFFMKIIQDLGTAEGVIVFTDISKRQMMTFLDYIYKGRVSVPKESVSTFMSLLKKFEVQFPCHENGAKLDDLEVHNRIENGKLSLSPVLMEAAEENLRMQCEQHVHHGDTSKGESTSQKGSAEHKVSPKVVNPFAVRARSSKGSNSSIQYATGSPKKESTVVSCAPLNGDSDVEVIEKDHSVFLITDTQESSSPEMCSKARKRPRVSVHSKTKLGEVELTSDDSDFTFCHVRKNKRVGLTDKPGEDSDNSKTVSKTGKNVSDSHDSRKANPRKTSRLTVVDNCRGDVTAPLAVKNSGPLNTKGSDDVASTSKNASSTDATDPRKEPFPSYSEIPFRKLKKFCVNCRYFIKKEFRQHIKQNHNKPVRIKRYVCQSCFAKFGSKKALGLHVCKK